MISQEMEGKMNDDFSITHGYSARKRARIQEAAGIIGINEAYLSDMVDAFYARVRVDVRLGPVFQVEIGEDWGPHLERMKRFWASVALNTGVYSGKPVAVHQRLHGVERGDFDRWLGLFRATLEDTAPSQEAINYLMLRAERIALSLRNAMFEKTRDGVPALH